jgi:peptidoglycan endopeptidase LytE
MRDRVSYIIGLVFMLLVFSVNAQVPLFLEDQDSIPQHDSSHLKKAQPSQKKIVDEIDLDQPVSSKIDSLIAYAHKYYGNRYRRGGTTSAGFDCSGYTMTVFKHVGIKLPHTSAGQGLMGYSVAKQNIQKGDLILFRGSNRRSARIGHVGIVISEKGEPIKFIHSSTSAGVRVDMLNYPYYKNRYVKTVRMPELYK